MTQDLEIRVVKCCTLDDGVYFGRGVHDSNIPGDGPWYVQKWVDGVIVADRGYGTRDQAIDMLESLLSVLKGESYRLFIDPWD